MLARSKIFILAALALCLVAGAEQIRVVVTAPVVVGETNGVGGQAALWQALVVTELSRSDWVALVDRDDLPQAVREWAMAATTENTTNGTIRPAWQGADLLVSGQLSMTNGACVLAVKVLDAQLGTIEAMTSESFPPTELETRARAWAERLKPLAFRWLARRDIHTLVSVVDYECPNPLPRSQWQDRALARSIRTVMMREPGVLVLEREDVDALFTEVRLQRGGFTQVPTTATNQWAGLRNYYLVSGSLHETQPQGQPLAISVTTQIKNLQGNQSRSFEDQYPFQESEPGISHLATKIRDALVSTNAADTPYLHSEANRSAEAESLIQRAFTLINIPDVREEVFAVAYAWELRPPAFNVEGFSDNSAARKANVLRAIQYVQSAWIADEHNALAGALLSTIQMDHQVGRTNEAVEIAEEIAAHSKAYQQRAWFFLARNTTGAKSRYYRQLLLDNYSGSVEALMARKEALEEIKDKHRSDPDLTAAVAEFRTVFDQLLSSEASYVAGNGYEVNCLFELTQIGQEKTNQPNKYDLRDSTSRALGTQLLEEMVAKHPERAYTLITGWLAAWQRNTVDDAAIGYWLKRAADAISDDPINRSSGVIAKDETRLSLAKRLMDQGQFKEALPYLLQMQSKSGLHAAEKDLRIGRCEFELADYALALERFEGLGLDNKEAVDWAEKCRAKLGADAPAKGVKPFTVSATPVSWKTKNIPLPPAGINDMKQDGTSVWLGLGPSSWDEQSRELANNDPAAGSAMAGGLVRFDTASGETTAYPVGASISYPWVTSLAIASGRVWVGTYGQGIDVFDKATGQWSNFNETNGLPMNYVQCLDADADSLWVGFSHNRQGAVARYVFKTGQWQTFLPTDYPAKSGPPAKRIFNVKSVAGNVWFLTDRESIGRVPVYRYETKANQWTCYYTTNFTVSLGVAADRVWFGPAARGSGRGGYEESLVSCKPDGTDWQTIRKQDGMPAFPVDSILERNHLVLLGGNGGTVMVFDPNQKHFNIFQLPSKSWGYVTALLGVGDEIWMGRSSPQGQLQALTVP